MTQHKRFQCDIRFYDGESAEHSLGRMIPCNNPLAVIPFDRFRISRGLGKSHRYVCDSRYDGNDMDEMLRQMGVPLRTGVAILPVML